MGVAEHMRSADKRAFSATYRFPHRPTVSEEAKSFMRSLLASAPADRPTAEQALRDQTWVRHPDYEPTCDFPCEPQEVEEEEAEPPLPLPHTVSEIGTPMTPRQSSAREPSGSGSPMAAWARSNVDWARSKTTDVFGRLLFHS
jgi:serine/threonine protein kinase